MYLEDNIYFTLEDFRKIVVNLTRCEHGRVQGDSCYSCPDRISPSQEGRKVGYSLDGTYRIVIPNRQKMHDPKNWYIEQ